MVSEHRASKLVLGLALGVGCVAVLVVVAMTVVLPALLIGGLSGDPATASGRTVLLIAVDDLRRDALAFQGRRGDDLDPTPTLSRFAREGWFARDYVPASTGTGPSLAALLTGLGPDEAGFTSQRTFGAHRLPRAADTLAERFVANDWSTVAAFALPQDDDRLSGLGQGFGDVLGAPPDGRPLAASSIVAGLVDLVEEAGPGDVFAFAHLADLRADWEPPLDAARVAPLLERRLAPLRASDPELARRLDEPVPNADGSKPDLVERIDRRRGSLEWLALQEARYDARLEALDAALGDLLDGLAGLGRDAPLVVVAGTRGRLLGVEPPEDGPPIELSEALLRTAFVVAPGEFRGQTDDAELERIDRATRVAPWVRGTALGVPLPEPRHGDTRVVTGPGQASRASVGAKQKSVGTGRTPASVHWDRGWFDRATDTSIRLGDAGEDVTSFGPSINWELTLEPLAGSDLVLRFSSAEGAICDLSGGLSRIVASPTGKSAEARATEGGWVSLSTVTGRESLVMTLTGAAGELVILGQGPGERGGSEPLVSHLVPVFPARPADGEEADPALTLAADGAWTRVSVAAGSDVELALWLSPPNADARAPQVEVASGDARVETFPGLDAVRVRAAGPFVVRVRRGGGQSIAVAGRIDGRVLQPGEMRSDEGGEPFGSGSLSLCLPPVDVGAFQVLADGATVLDAVAAYAGLPLEPPYALTEQDARLLLRLGPLE